MHSLSALFSSFVAALVLATPVLGIGNGAQITLFKRDAPLTSRDLESAAMHGVNITEMFRHTIVKRSNENGDPEEWTIWVHNSFQEFEEELPSESASISRVRARQVHAKPVSPLFSGGPYQCAYYTYTDKTSTSSPTTGGTDEIVRWCDARRGYFDLNSAYELSNPTRQILIVAGSNGGTNALFRTEKIGTNEVEVGTWDIRDLVRESGNRYKRQINGKWYLGAEGGINCFGTFLPIPWYNVRWFLVRTDRRSD
ncbi:hypothetical protein F5X68DRAFT_234619 [Plectosphaerella plurivora]|uniref:Ecp2 effector protein-like domain-containing protein n=1 Tax=Plectosphaerella plurivora TaxID=936078 RepID=A0A9P9A9A8_9PEZI|nr:hypothetical protein F5X68DRAFT_234619 [Plectosphaerella plurivora]